MNITPNVLEMLLNKSFKDYWLLCIKRNISMIWQSGEILNELVLILGWIKRKSGHGQVELTCLKINFRIGLGQVKGSSDGWEKLKKFGLCSHLNCLVIMCHVMFLPCGSTFINCSQSHSVKNKPEIYICSSSWTLKLIYNNVVLGGTSSVLCATLRRNWV